MTASFVAAYFPIGRPIPEPALSQEAETLQLLLGQVNGGIEATIGFGDRTRDLDKAAWAAAEDDWDGNGALAVDLETYRRAKIFLKRLPLAVKGPSISADVDGEISLTWVKAPKDFYSVSISRDGRLSIAEQLGTTVGYSTEHFDNEIPPAVLAKVAEFFTAGPTTD